jgi:hypothetical protein
MADSVVRGFEHASHGATKWRRRFISGALSAQSIGLKPYLLPKDLPRFSFHDIFLDADHHGQNLTCRLILILTSIKHEIASEPSELLRRLLSNQNN